MTKHAPPWWAAALRSASVFMMQTAVGYKLATDHLLSTTVAFGPSMMPTIDSRPDGTFCFVDMTAAWRGFKAGDVVLAHQPDRPGTLICKRLIAGPGAKVHVPLAAASGAGVHMERTVTVPPGHVWLAGDNVPLSVDSRAFGPLPYQMLIGRPFLVIDSWTSWRLLDNKIPDIVARTHRMEVPA